MTETDEALRFLELMRDQMKSWKEKGITTIDEVIFSIELAITQLKGGDDSNGERS